MIGMGNNQQRTGLIQTQSYPPFFLVTMLFIEQRQSIWIQEYCGSAFERNTMFSCILPGFSGVPLKVELKRHWGIISQNARQKHASSNHDHGAPKRSR